MSTFALTGNQRRWLSKLHRWSGLALLVFLLIAGITGSVLAFRLELDAWLNPQLYKVEQKGQRATIDEAIAAAETRFPEAYVSSITLPQEPDNALKFFLNPKMEAGMVHVHVPGMKSTLEFNQVFVDPYARVVLGQRNTSRFDLFSREGFIPTTLRLHYMLFLDKVGVYTMGIVSLIWLLTTIIGAALSWPRIWHSMGAWRKVLEVRWRGGGYKINYDLHRSAGLIFLPVLVVVSFTGIYLNLPDVVKPVVRTISSLTVNPKGVLQSIEDDRITPEQAIEIALDSMPHARVHSVTRSFANGWYSVRVQLPDDVSPNGNNIAYVSMSSGKLMGFKSAATATGGDTFLYWQQPLHSGRAFGLAGQILIFISALVMVAMCITGFNVWLRKHRSRHQQALRQQSAPCVTSQST